MINSSKEIIQAAGQFCFALFACMVFIPLSLVTKKKKNRLVFICRDSGAFTDNVKHFFIFLCRTADSDIDLLFISTNKKTHQLLTEANLPSALYPRWKSVSYLLTANLVVVDWADWIWNGRYQLAFKSKIIQLWHGAPLKEIELPDFQRRLQRLPPLLRWLLLFYKKINGRYATYEIVVSTSSFFTKHAFQDAFNTRRIVETGYPRNDAILRCRNNTMPTDPAWLNTDQSIIERLHQARKSGIRTILYAPTFRKDLRDPFAQKIIDLHRLNRFAERHNMLITMKLHPAMRISPTDASHQCLLHYDPSADIYPALSLFDILITDYSSIYFDYLLLDRPIIFFPYDYEHYLAEERKLLFDYNDMAPGPICATQKEVEKAILHTSSNHFSLEMAKVRNLVFSHCDARASSRLCEIIKTDYLDMTASTSIKAEHLS